MLFVANNWVTEEEPTAVCTSLMVSCMDFVVSVKITCTTTVKIADLLLLLCVNIITLVSGTPNSMARADLRLLRTDWLTCCEKVNVTLTTYSDGTSSFEELEPVRHSFEFLSKVVPDGHVSITQ